MYINLNHKLKAAAFMLALMTLSACSSSQPDGEFPAETAAAAEGGEATTDSVPVDPAIEMQGANDGNISAAPDALAADAPPMEDPNLASPPLSESSVDASLDVPPGDAPPAVTEGGPVVDLAEVSPDPVPMMNEEPQQPVAHKKKRRNKRSHSQPVGEDGSYAVRRGDTLMKIAFEQYGDLYRWREIYEANRDRIQDPNHVPPGTQLVLNGAGQVQIERNGERYLIKHGDTLGTISREVYGSPRKWKHLWENNRQLIKDPNKIYAGFYLFYQPEGKLTNGPAADPINAEAPAVEGDYGAKVKVPATNPINGNPTKMTAPRAPASVK